jgi:hypothetical protein
MENILVKENSYAIVKTIAITLSIAVIYWMICMYTPELSKASVTGLFIGKTIKLANMLRALLIISPAAVIGTGIGAWMFNLSTGTAGLSAYPILPIVVTSIALGFHKVSQKIGRSTLKDLTILGLYGLVSSSIVAFNLLIYTLIMAPTTVLTSLVIWKIVVGTLTVMAGYSLVLVWEKFSSN